MYCMQFLYVLCELFFVLVYPNNTVCIIVKPQFSLHSRKITNDSANSRAQQT